MELITEDSVNGIAVGDANNDGQLEVIIGNCYNIYCIEGTTGLLIWETHINSRIVGLALGDVNGDNKTEIVVSSEQKIYCISGQDGSILWEFSTDYGVLVRASPLLCDVNNDRKLEIIFGIIYSFNYTLNGHIYCLDGKSGSLIWNFTTNNLVYACSFGDINNDSKIEIIGISVEIILRKFSSNIYCCNSENCCSYVYCLSGENGSLIWMLPIENSFYDVLLVDVDMNHIPEVLVCGHKFYCIRGKDGSLIWKRDIQVSFPSQLAVGDFNGDGKPEIIFGTTSSICCINAESQLVMWKFELPYSHMAYINEEPHGIALGDFNDDNRLDVIVTSDIYYLNETDGKCGAIYCLDGEFGSLLWKFVFKGYLTAPILADVDNDAKIEIIVGSTNHTVYCLDIKNAGFRIYWQGDSGDIFFHNSRNQFFVDRDYDFLSDYSENIIGSNPLDPDTDDGISDGMEVFLGTDPLHPNYSNVPINWNLIVIVVILCIFVISIFLYFKRRS